MYTIILKKYALLTSAICIFGIANVAAQTVKILASGNKVSLRGLSVPDNKTVWVSGSNGTVALSTDSGNTWKWKTVKGFEKADFRDIESFDAKTAVIMAIDSPAYILKTIDGGDSWKIVFEDHAHGMFLDAMEFWNERSGIVIGDPIDGKFFIARTFDGGDTWRSIPGYYRPQADTGEACFASSGTNIRSLKKDEAVFVSGGMVSHIFIRDKKITLPLLQNKETTGANSVAVKKQRKIMVVGGDFMAKDSMAGNCTFSNDGGNSWRLPLTAPHGYRSCVEWIGGNSWVTCGLNGVDLSKDEGLHFELISHEGFHACRKAKKGNLVYFAGGNGRIGRLQLK